MKRTTLSLAPALLKAIKEIARQEGVAMRKVMSDLMELGLKTRVKADVVGKSKRFRWPSQSMKAKVDLEDKEQVCKILDLEK